MKLNKFHMDMLIIAIGFCSGLITFLITDSRVMGATMFAGLTMLFLLLNQVKQDGEEGNINGKRKKKK